MESNLNSKKMLEEYNKCKNNLEEIYDNIAEGAKVRSKISWYEEGEKSSKTSNLEKTKAVQVIIKKPEIENKEIGDPNEISNKTNRFFKKFEKVFKRFPVLTEQQKQDCEKEISEK